VIDFCKTQIQIKNPKKILKINPKFCAFLLGFLGFLNWVFVLCINLKISNITSAKCDVLVLLVLSTAPVKPAYTRGGGFGKF
jgi:hypothetical protein